MKIPKNLLTAIAVGVVLGGTTTSCDVMFASAADLVEEKSSIDLTPLNGSSTTAIRCGNGIDHCPGCGMG